MQFLTYSIGLNATRTGTPSLTKVSVYKTGAFIMLQAVSGHNLSNKPGFYTMSEEDYQNLPTDSIERARAMLALCGYEA